MYFRMAPASLAMYFLLEKRTSVSDFGLKMAAPATGTSTLLPLELVDKAIGSRIHIIMKNDKVTVKF
jgi:hypothetical protein